MFTPLESGQICNYFQQMMVDVTLCDFCKMDHRRLCALTLSIGILAVGETGYYKRHLATPWRGALRCSGQQTYLSSQPTVNTSSSLCERAILDVQSRGLFR